MKPWPLEPEPALFRQRVELVLDRLVPWLASLEKQPMHHTAGGRKLARAIREDLPEEGTSFRRLLGQLFERLIPASLNTASPGYLAYIPGGGLTEAAIADLIADVTNRYTGLWMPAPGLVQLEINVLRWLCAMVGFGEGSGGILTTGGSMANLGALVAARQDLLGEDFFQGVIYTSAQAHHSMRKAAIVAGFPRSAFREIPVDDAFRLRPELLRAAIAEDRAAGRRPLMVAAQAGSTAVGAVDPLDALADVCAQEGLWLHVDAAYGGFFCLTTRGKGTLRGIERADSVTLDPHKGLFLPYGTGALVVRDLKKLRAAHAVTASYLPAPQEDPDAWDFADLGPELSRDFRGLRVWLPLKLHGAKVFREALDEKLDLTRQLSDAVRLLPTVRIVSDPVLSLFSFRFEPPDRPEESWDAFNRKVMSGVNQRQRVLLTGVTIEDPKTQRPIFVIRACVLSFRTHADRIQMAADDLQAALEEVRAGERTG